MTWSRIRVGALAVGIASVFALVTATGSAATPAELVTTKKPAAPGSFTTAEKPLAKNGKHSVTLITGDVVDYTLDKSGQPSLSFRPAPRPDGALVAFHSFPVNGRTLVLPSDVIGLVASGKLDKSLFDIEALAEHKTTKVIVDYTGPVLPAVAKSALDGAKRGKTLRTLGAAGFEVRDAREFWKDLAPASRGTTQLASGIEKVWLDATVKAEVSENMTQIGAPTAWQLGLDGKGTKVAVLDTGIDFSHPDFAGRLGPSANFVGGSDAQDDHGHGTHVASTAAGSGAGSGGTYRGVASGATILAGKVLNKEGQGSYSSIIAGMEWAVGQGVDVVNMSLGGAPTDGTDPLSTTLNQLSRQSGSLFVVAASNNGGRLTVGSPGAADEALTVGAVDKSDMLASFSSKGPRLVDAAVKPNLTAPGVGIVGARAEGTDGPEPVDALYTRASGTSMATPHVAGAALLLAQQHPEWSGDELRDALSSTTKKTDGLWFDEGSGRLDVARAVTQQVFAETSIDFGTLNRQSGRRTKQLTFRNTGSESVTLRPTIIDDKGWSGADAPSGSATLSDTETTVPPSGTATVDLTIDPSLGNAGAFGGRVVAATEDGKVHLTTPFSYYTGPPARVLDVQLLGPDGAGENPYNQMVVLALPIQTDSSGENPFASGLPWAAADPEGHATLTLAEGDYELIGLVGVSNLHSRYSYVIQPISLTGNREVTLDARKALPIKPKTAGRTDVAASQTMLVRDLPGRPEPFWLRGTLPGYREGLFVTPMSKPTVGTRRFSQQTILPEAAVQSMKAGSIALEPAYHVDTVRSFVAGRHTYPLVNAGQGRPEDFAGLDVKGKVVLIGIPLPDSSAPWHTAHWSAYDKAGLARSLGAVAALVYMDVPGAKAQTWQSGPLPAFGLSQPEGARLRSQTSITIEGLAAPRTVYRLRYDRTGEIRDRPETVDLSQLAKLTSSYHSGTGSSTIAEQWTTTTDGTALQTLQTQTDLTAPVKRAEFVGPIRDNLFWTRVFAHQRDRLTMGSYDTFRSGRFRPVEHWFATPLVPGAADVGGRYPVTLPCSLCWSGDRFLSAQLWLDRDRRHVGSLGSTSTARLYRNGVELAAGSDRSFTLPGGAANFRLETVDRVPGRTGAVTTSREFRMRPPAGKPKGYTCPYGDVCGFTPAIQLAYDIPVDLANSAPAGTSYLFAIQASVHSLAPNRPAVRRIAVEYSVDGNTWQPASTWPLGDGRFAVKIRHPALTATNGFVSLRVRATDSAGGSITQTVDRAYALR